MSFRHIASAAFLPLLLTLSLVPAANAAPAPAAAPPPAAPAAAPGGEAPAAPQFSINQPYGDWAVRCALETVKSPAPCDVIQLTVNQDTKQRIMSFSLAYVPSRDSFAMQLIVPIGVALARGLSVASGSMPLENIKYNRCERDGCYVELLVDAPTVAALQAIGGQGKSTTVTVFSYGQFTELKLPVSLNGFPDAMERMKTLARQRAVALPASAQTPTPASGTAAAGAARPAAPAPARAGAAPARGAATPGR